MYRLRHVLLASLFLTLSSGCYTDVGAADDVSSIVGTWQLTHRELPDGSRVSPPKIKGLLTYTRGHRNFNVYWEDSEGKPFSLSLMSRYELSEKQFKETCYYLLENDGIGGGGVRYEQTETTGTGAVEREGGKIEIDLPLFDEPVLVFDGDSMTATREGEFVDHWKRIE